MNIEIMGVIIRLYNHIFTLSLISLKKTSSMSVCNRYTDNVCFPRELKYVYDILSLYIL